MRLQTYKWTDGLTDGQNDGQTDKIMGGQTNEWMDMQCMCIDMQKTFFIRFCNFYDSIMDEQTDRQRDQQTDKPSHSYYF